jgi:hypothetical protein
VSYPYPENVSDLLERIRYALWPKLPADELPPAWQRFRYACERREGAGPDGLLTVLVNHVATECLQHRDEAGIDDLDISLNIIRHAFRAHEGLAELEGKRRGSP